MCICVKRKPRDGQLAIAGQSRADLASRETQSRLRGNGRKNDLSRGEKSFDLLSVGFGEDG